MSILSIFTKTLTQKYASFQIIIIFCLPTRKLRQMGLKLIGITQPDRIKIKLNSKTINISAFSISNDSDTKLLSSDWRKFL